MSKIKTVPSGGIHLIIEMYGAKNLTDAGRCRIAMKEAAEKAGATVLSIHVHDFKTQDMPEAGFTGVAVLAESHISVHTWPEENYAAWDIFMCGDSQPEKALAVLNKYFHPEKVITKHLQRGVIPKL